MNKKLDMIKSAVGIRHEVAELNREYRKLGLTAQALLGVNYSDFRMAVDALYYFGSKRDVIDSRGWMEREIDSVAGMFKVLSFIGRGDIVIKRMKLHKIDISLQEPLEDAKLPDKVIKLLRNSPRLADFSLTALTRKQLMTQLVRAAVEIRNGIYHRVDAEKDIVKEVKTKFKLQEAELVRLGDMIKLQKNPERRTDRALAAAESMSSYNSILKSLKLQPIEGEVLKEN